MITWNHLDMTTVHQRPFLAAENRRAAPANGGYEPKLHRWLVAVASPPHSCELLVPVANSLKRKYAFETLDLRTCQW